MPHLIFNRTQSADKRVTVHRQVITVNYKPSPARRAELAAAKALKEAATTQEAAKPAPKAGKRKPKLRETPRRGKPDDLKQISGIGTVLEQTLNQQGIYHLDQIAGWDEANLAWIDENWSCGNKIRRDNWVAQAKALTQL